MRNVTLAAVSRFGDDFDKLYKMSDKLSEYGKVFVVNNDSIRVSSSEIREKIKNNEDLYCYLDQKVVKYIMRKKLYRI